MCILTDSLPTAAAGLPCETDFRAMIWFETQLLKLDTSDKNQAQSFAEEALRRFYGCIPADVNAAWEGLQRFYACGKDSVGGADAGPAQRLYDFEADAERLVAAFRQAYQIDLIAPETRLHWWTFRALQANLPPGSVYSKVLEYRAADISSLPEGSRGHYRQMQQRFALPSVAADARAYTADALEADFLRRIRGGGDADNT